MKSEKSNYFYRESFIKTSVFVVGFSSVFAQSLFLRELIVSFYGNELAAGIILSSWLLWTGCGSFLFSRYKSVTFNTFLNYQVIFSVLLLVELVLIRHLRDILHFSPGEVIPPFPMFIAGFFSLAPFAVINGALFSAAVGLLSLDMSQRSAGVVYSIDALGDMAGGILFSFFFVFLVSPLENILILLALNIMVISLGSIKSSNVVRKFFLAVLAGVVIVLGVNSRKLEWWLRRHQWRGFNLVDSKSSLYGDFDITEYGGSFSLYENGVLGFSFPAVMESEETVHFSCLESNKVERILVVGEAVKGLLYELLKYPVKEVVYLEMAPDLVRFVKKYLPRRDREALSDKRVRVLNMEARRFFNTYKGKKFDVVILNTPPPYTLYLNRFYTFEFFCKVKSFMNEGGVFSFVLPSKESYLPPELRGFTASVYYTLMRVFPYVVLVPGDKLRFIASSVGDFLTYSPDVLAQRMEEYGVGAKFVNKYYFQSRLLPWHIHDVTRILQETRKVRLNYDFFPVTYYYGMGFFSSHFRSHIRNVFVLLSHINPVFYLLLLTVTGILFLFLSPRGVVAFSVFGLGFAGMTSVILCIIGYQIVYGYVYHKIGLISASFMFGAALGANFSDRYCCKKDEVRLLRIMSLGASLYVLVLPIIFKFSPSTSLGMESMFLFLPVVMGMVTGVSFPVASRLYAGKTNSLLRGAGLLYALDLCGGAVAGLILSMVFIPLYGIFLSSGIISYLLFISWLLVMAKRNF